MKRATMMWLTLITKKYKSNWSVGLRIYCAARKEMIQQGENPIVADDFKWIFARDWSGAEQLRVI